ncbi:MAG: UBP-type zinc finger domain-containing protein [Chloroflexota bacterium]
MDTVRRTKPEQSGCASCVAEGSRTVHLRMCLSCGEVACCDSSPGKHARRHHEQTGHPLIRSIEPGEHWVWCYLDRAYRAEL